MLRLQCSSTRRFLKCQKPWNSKQARRTLSSYSKGPNPVVFVAAATTLVAGSTVAYARFDDSFRSNLKSRLPSFLAKNDWILGVIKDDVETPALNKDLSLPFQKLEVGEDEMILGLPSNGSEEKLEQIEEAPSSDIVVSDEVASELETIGASEKDLEAVTNEQDNETVSETVASEEVVDPIPAIETIETPEPSVESAEDHVHLHTAVDVSEVAAPVTSDADEDVVEVHVENVAENAEVTLESSGFQVEEVATTEEAAVQDIAVSDDDVQAIVVEAVETKVVEEESPAADVEAAVEDEQTNGEVAAASLVTEAVETSEVEQIPVVSETVLVENVDDEGLAVVETVQVAEESSQLPDVVESAVAQLAPQLEEDPEKIAAEKQAAAEALRLIEEEEAEKAATTAILQAFMSRGHHACEVAVDIGTEAASLADSFVDQLEKLLNNLSVSKEEENEIFTELTSLSEQKEKVLKKAVDLHTIAAKEFAQIDNVLEHVKKGGNKEDYEDAEEYLNKLKNVLKESTSCISDKIDKITSTSKVITCYRKMIGSEPIAFLEIPEEECSVTNNNLRAPEMRRILALLQDHLEEMKKEVLLQQENFNQRLQQEVEAACQQTEQKVMEIMSEETLAKLEQAKVEFEIEKSDVQLSHEEEMKHQLKRQAAAHVLHLTDALKYMQDQLDEEHKEDIKKQMEEQANTFQQTISEIHEKYSEQIREINYDYAVKVSAAKARLEGFEFSVDVKSVYDNYLYNANNLAIACEGLVRAIQDSTTLKPEEPRSIATEVERVVSASLGDPTLQAIVSQIPEEVVEKGLYTETALRTAFKPLSELCCRLSLVSDAHNSLWTYFLSYFKSMLIFRKDEIEPPSSVDAEKLDVFKIVSYANYCLQRGELEQAARFVNQMTGQPRTIAERWLHEVRLYLETIHAIDALSTLSSAVVVGAQSRGESSN